MRVGLYCAAIAGFLAVSVAGSATAATFCVGVERADCQARATAAQAFADAADGDRVELGPITVSGALSTAKDLTVAGAGAGNTVLAGGLTLSNPKAEISRATIHELRLGGTAGRVEVVGLAELRGGDAVLQGATVRGAGGVEAVEGGPRLDTVVLDLDGGAGLRVRCGATLHARHVTLIGTPSAAVTTACATAVARIRDSILWGGPEAGFTGTGRVLTDHTNHRPVPGHAPGAGDTSVDPRFEPGSARPAPGSPMIDAGAAEPLDDVAWAEDRDGLPRIADGDGDGVPERDLGAFERMPAPVAPPPGNLLADPGAEHGGAWQLAGGLARERYGADVFPSGAAGAALGGGERFFGGGTGAGASTATQAVGVLRVAPEIDLGGATASLSALLGGYRGEPDAGVVEARFRDAVGRTLGTALLGTPTAAERAHTPTLLPRGRTDAVPPLTRSIVVTLRATGAGRGSYDDAYFDNVALTVAAPGAPGVIGGRERRFAGVRVLSARPRLDRRRRLPLRLACPTRTVGACSGALTLARGRGASVPPQRLAAVPFRVAAGRVVRVRVPLGRAARKHRRLQVHVAARDAQGVVRTAVVPVRVRRR